MALPTVMVLPMLIVVAAGIYYIYNEIIQYMSKSMVKNKVVVITDAVSGVGSGEDFIFLFVIQSQFKWGFKHSLRRMSNVLTV